VRQLPQPERRVARVFGDRDTYAAGVQTGLRSAGQAGLRRFAERGILRAGEQRVALVTGSSSGIGAAVARRMAGSGIRVVVNSSRSVDAGKALADELPDAHYLQADVAEEEQAQQLIAGTIERMNEIARTVSTAVDAGHADFAAARHAGAARVAIDRRPEEPLRNDRWYRFQFVLAAFRFEEAPD